MDTNLKTKPFLVACIVVGGLVVVGLGLSLTHSVEVNQKASADLAKMEYPVARLSGVRCANSDHRPLAVMVSSDPEARPLSGISQADMVFELPVTPSGVTRMMAVFQCVEPSEVGSVRSARLDFVPIALGLGAVYAHWGGEHTVLEELNNHIVDNIDGLRYDGTIYYRKTGIKPPHNGFSNYKLLRQAMQANHYDWRLVDQTPAYQFNDAKVTVGTQTGPTIYADQFQVSWRYDAKSNGYIRSRNGQIELDKISSQAVNVKNVLVMHTTWSPISKDYLRVKTIGSGQLEVYSNGQIISGSWEKQTDQGKLFFYDQNHKEIKLVTGNSWIEVVI